MRVEYEDDDLRRLAEELDYRPKRWDASLIRTYRKKIQILLDATDERDLRAMRSLRLEQLAADRAGTSSIRLTRQFRLMLKFVTNDLGRSVVVLELGDYH